LATWTTSNTKPIERKFYQQELDEHLNQNENIKDDHKHDNKKKWISILIYNIKSITQSTK